MTELINDNNAFVVGVFIFLTFFIYDSIDRLRAIREYSAFGMQGHLIPYLKIKRPIEAFYAGSIIILDICMIALLIFLTALHYNLF